MYLYYTYLYISKRSSIDTPNCKNPDIIPVFDTFNLHAFISNCFIRKSKKKYKKYILQFHFK